MVGVLSSKRQQKEKCITELNTNEIQIQSMYLAELRAVLFQYARPLPLLTICLSPENIVFWKLILLTILFFGNNLSWQYCFLKTNSPDIFWKLFLLTVVLTKECLLTILFGKRMHQQSCRRNLPNEIVFKKNANLWQFLHLDCLIQTKKVFILRTNLDNLNQIKSDQIKCAN